MYVTLIISAAFVILLGLWAHAKSKKHDEAQQIYGIFVIILLLIVLGNFIALSGARASTRADVRQFEASRATIEQQRNDSLSSFERVQLTQLIVQKNEWLAKSQFWATNPWQNWYYDQSILTVKPIQ